MNKTTFFKYLGISLLVVFTFFSTTAFSQVGIGTTTPDATAVLDVSSTTQGLLTPRMTTTQRNAIVSPANGLMVYDTTLKSFYYYDTTTTAWISMNAATSYGRLKFKRIKSTDVLATILADEKTAGGGAKYLLDTGTLYEINGTINVDLPIDLNNAYIAGLDTNEDKLVKASGSLFAGSTGGSIRNVTLQATGGSVFALTGTAAEAFVFRDAIVTTSQSVGTISGFGLVFSSVVQYLGNSNGVTYTNITKLLLSNMGWFGNNLGTFEKLTGTFGLVQKQSGFSEVNGAAIGFDVSSNPTITSDAVMQSVVFTGTLSSGAYVKGYTVDSYTGYSFNNRWSVNCAGIAREDDAVATGDMNFDYAVGSGASTTFNTSNPSNITKLLGTSGSNTLFRFKAEGSNRLKYQGLKKRFFQIAGSVSFQVSNPGTYIIYIAKNGSAITQYKIYGRGLVSSDILVLPVIAATELSTDDYIEVYVQRYTSTSSADFIVTPNLNIVVN